MQEKSPPPVSANPFDYNYNTNYHQQTETENATEATQHENHTLSSASGNQSPTSPSKFFATFSTQANYIPPVLSPTNVANNEINANVVEHSTTREEILEFDDAYTWQMKQIQARKESTTWGIITIAISILIIIFSVIQFIAASFYLIINGPYTMYIISNPDGSPTTFEKRYSRLLVVSLIIFYLSSVGLLFNSVIGICSGSVMRRVAKLRLLFAILFLLGIVCATAFLLAANGLLIIQSVYSFLGHNTYIAITTVVIATYVLCVVGCCSVYISGAIFHIRAIQKEQRLLDIYKTDVFV